MNAVSANPHQNGNHKNWLEWTIFFIGLILTLAVLGYLVYAVIIFKHGFPDLHIEYRLSDEKTERNKLFLIVKNKGETTAESVKVSAHLWRDNKELENGEIEIQYVPKHSKRNAWVIFEHPIEKSDSLTVNIHSYLDP